MPKISQKNNFLKKPVTEPGTTRTGRKPGSRFRFPKTRNRGTPVPIPSFGQKLGNWTRLTLLLISVKCHLAHVFFKNKIFNKFTLTYFNRWQVSFLTYCFLIFLKVIYWHSIKIHWNFKSRPFISIQWLLFCHVSH